MLQGLLPKKEVEEKVRKGAEEKALWYTTYHAKKRAAEETGGDARCYTPLQAALYGSERSSESFIKCMVLEWGEDINGTLASGESSLDSRSRFYGTPLVQAVRYIPIQVQ